MNPEIQDHIFEPFFTTKSKDKGTGLGLSTVYGIIKQSNGFIDVHSESGLGASFSIYFPQVNRDASEDPRVKVKPASLRGSETILVAEDEPAVRPLICRMLRDRGYQVFEAAEANEALDIAQKYAGSIHAVIADVIMPGMSGKHLVFQLKLARPEMKVLYISGYTNEAIVHHGVLDAEVAFLQKPFTADDLALKLRSVLDGYLD
jgi:two-component system, cell cycle sensor histidine kinase and response regulator CckA